MEIERSIVVIGLEEDILKFSANWDEGSEENKKSFTVLIDNKNTGGGFRYETYGDDWFEIILNENTFTIVVKENFNINERNGYIVLHHNSIQGEAGEKTVNIKQSGVECNIKIEISDDVKTADDGTKYVECTSILPYTTDNNEVINVEEKNIILTVTGGDRKYFIKSFKKYKKIKINNIEQFVVGENDRGIKVEKVSDSLLRITNYGRVYKNNGEYYEIVLAHNNDISKTQAITVKYDTVIIQNTVLTRVLTRKSLQADSSNIIQRIPTFEEKYGQNNEPIEIGLEIFGLNVPIVTLTKNGRRRTKQPDEEIVFEKEGGVKEFDFTIQPEGSMFVVEFSSNFVKYNINKNKLILTAEPNTSPFDRRCTMKIRHAKDPFIHFIKTIVLKGSS